MDIFDDETYGAAPQMSKTDAVAVDVTAKVEQDAPVAVNVAEPPQADIWENVPLQSATGETLTAPAVKMTNAEVLRSPFMAEEKAPRAKPDTLPLPSMSGTGINDVLADTRKAWIQTPEDQRWVSVAHNSSTVAVNRDAYTGAVTREGSTWSQGVRQKDGAMQTLSRPIFQIGTDEKLTGQRAVWAARTRSGFSAFASVLAYHTGARFQLAAPSEVDVIRLYDTLSSSKSEFGRRTYGRIFSTELGYHFKTYADFVIAHIDGATLSVQGTSEYYDKIDIFDIPVLLNGMASAFWADGFKYVKSCMADPEHCHHVVEEVVDLRYMQFTDTSALTSYQINDVMSLTKTGSVTPEMYRRYQEEYTQGVGFRKTLCDGVEVVLGRCTLTRYFNEVEAFVAEAQQAFPELLELPQKDRAEKLDRIAQSQAMRQYTHFVKEIRIGGGIISVDNENGADDIRKVINQLSANDEARSTFFKAVQEFMDASVITLVAVPSYDCPACGKPQVPPDANGSFPGIIPIDPFRVFFYLLPQVIQRIDMR